MLLLDIKFELYIASYANTLLQHSSRIRTSLFLLTCDGQLYSYTLLDLRLELGMW